MSSLASSIAGVLVACACFSAASTSWAQAPGDDAFVPTIAPPAPRAEQVESPTRMKSGVMVGLGIASTVIGAAEGVLGTVLVVGDAQNDNGMFDGFGTFFGTIALVDAAIHLGVGIPLIVVGAQREPVAPEGDKDGIDSAQVSIRGSEVVASFTF